MECPNCHQTIDNNSKFCPKCGHHAVAQLKIAYSNRRLFNTCIDFVGYIVFCFCYGFLFGIGAAIFGIDSSIFEEDDIQTILAGTGIILYYFLFEYYFGKTPGKFLTKTRVISADGQPLTPKQVFIRSLVRLVPFDWISFWGYYPVGWHDRWSGTRVVEDSTE